MNEDQRSQEHLRVAEDFIRQGDYATARKVLRQIPDNPTAKRWLARLNQLEWRVRRGKLEEQDRSSLVGMDLPPKVAYEMRDYLEADEVVLWFGRPDAQTFYRYFRPSWINYIYRGIGLFHFAVILWILVVGGIRSSTIVLLIEFFLGMLFLFLPEITKMRMNAVTQHIYYVVTQRRGVVVGDAELLWIEQDNAPNMELVDEKNGLHSVIFKRYTGFWDVIRIRLPVGFIGIEDADKLGQLIRTHWG